MERSSGPAIGVPRSSWTQKGSALLLILFCMELGLFLVVYPWTEKWDMNIVPALVPASRVVWLNGYFRGAVSGIGLINLWIALTETFRLTRFSSRP